jgi:hypothetical protein
MAAHGRSTVIMRFVRVYFDCLVLRWLRGDPEFSSFEFLWALVSSVRKRPPPSAAAGAVSCTGAHVLADGLPAQ